MQRHPMDAIGVDDTATLTSPTYPSHHMYEPSMPQPPPDAGRTVYYPYGQQDPSNSWTPYNGAEEYAPPPEPASSSWYPAGPSAGSSIPAYQLSPVQTSPAFAAHGGSYGRIAPPFPSSEYAPPMCAPSERVDLASDAGEAKEKSTAPKKKRKKAVERSASVGSGDAEKEKRTKTGRACDACRSKKIRCDILSQPESVDDDSPPICAHCKSHRFECTFFLPITETRFKKKKPAENGDNPRRVSATGYLGVESPIRPPGDLPSRVEGPTSLSFLLHTSLPASASEAYDLRYHHTWEVSEDGNGIIRVKAPPSSHTPAGENSDMGDTSYTHNKLNRPVINEHTISLLVNAYFDHLAHLFPVISRSEFAAKQTPPPLLLYSICGLGATRREFPREVFNGVRGVINGLLRSNDILSDAHIENVQALLVLAQVGDLHAQPTAATASASLMRTGSAIRMAQDLGLHRESHLRAQTPQDLAFVELRRRIWATCVIMDRWYGAAHGIPLQVDLLDCDVLLPASYDVIVGQAPSTWPIEPSFVALAEHLKLSILVGRVLKTIYSPTGLKHATDEQLYTILEVMRGWKEGLPESLKFAGPGSSFAAGLLHLAYTTLHFLLWRPFMRITYICPPHLKFALETMHWSEMAVWATEAIDWLHYNPEALDTVFIYSYAATSCALVQYHTWVRRREPGSLESLKQIRETAQNWETAVQPDQMSIRRKTCETMTLLYEAAIKTHPEDDRPPAINPTAGVLPRPALGKAIWLADASKPYGGIWVAQDNEEKADSGLTENSVVLKQKMGEERPPPEIESTDPTVRARALSRLRGTDTGTKGEERDNESVSPAKSYDEAADRRGGSGGRGAVHGPGPMQAPYQPLPTDIHPDLRQTHPYEPPSHDPMQIFRDMQMSGSNVNPQMNFGGLDFTGGVPNVGHGYNADPVSLTAYDPGVMDGLPVNGLNFDQWSTWFSNIDRLGPAEDVGLAAGYQQQQQRLQQQNHSGGGWDAQGGRPV